MTQEQFFTIISLIANKHGCKIDVDFSTKVITFKGSADDPISRLQMICDLENILGYHTTPLNECQNCQKEIYLGAVKINLD